MTVRQYLDALFERIRREFPDQDRPANLADVGLLYAVVSAHAAEARGVPPPPRDEGGRPITLP